MHHPPKANFISQSVSELSSPKGDREIIHNCKPLLHSRRENWRVVIFYSKITEEGKEECFCNIFQLCKFVLCVNDRTYARSTI